MSVSSNRVHNTIASVFFRVFGDNLLVADGGCIIFGVLFGLEIICVPKMFHR